MITIHMRVFPDLYAKLIASWFSIRDVKDILVTSKRSARKERTTLMKQVLVMMSQNLTL